MTFLCRLYTQHSSSRIQIVSVMRFAKNFSYMDEFLERISQHEAAAR